MEAAKDLLRTLRREIALNIRDQINQHTKQYGDLDDIIEEELEASADAAGRVHLQGVEQMGEIYMEFMAEYYGIRQVEVEDSITGEKLYMEFDFGVLRDVPCSIDLDAGASSYWSEIANMQTLDNLLMQGKIPTSEYLRRLPNGQITDREQLIAITQAAERGTVAFGGGADTRQQAAAVTDEATPPVRGGAGYGALQRKINESGEVPRMEA